MISSWEVSQLTPHGWHRPPTLGLISYWKLLVGKQGQNLPELMRWDLVILCIYLGSQLHYFRGKKNTGCARKQRAATPGETLSLLTLHMPGTSLDIYLTNEKFPMAFCFSFDFASGVFA